MNTRLAIVFAGFIAASPVSASDPASTARVGLDASKLRLASANVLVLDAKAGEPIYAKGADVVTPIASVTKLMTAMVVLDAGQPLDERIAVDIGDLDLLKGSHSRLNLGSELSRGEMLQVALMASENRAASSLARHYPGGTAAAVEAMNRKAQSLGMTHTHFSDPTGLSSENVSTAGDLARMVRAAASYPLIREATTTSSRYVEVQPTGRILGYNNTNSLVRSGQWDILVSKTGFIREAGKCLVMLANIASREVVIVLLDSYGRLTRIGDANRVKHWLETGQALPAIRSAKPRRIKGTLLPASTVRSPAKSKGRA
ncbi:MAG TPA: D-alanyl-D-alanine endopeptidase [Casimicrobiaceae bacterium]|nr:D-alanyl-D-alanine endopeptidase [Casimicrobiaceae bacterium]